MDQGNTVATEVDFNTPEIAGYMAQNMELLDCYQGLCHSHHTMDTFFSGTDMNTLKKEGIDMNNFVSLIVNNAGKYNANLTRKITYKTKDRIEREKSGQYTYFDQPPVQISGLKEIINKEYAEYFVEYVPLTVVREFVEEDETSVRFSEVQKRNEKKQKSQYNKGNFGNLFGDYNPYKPFAKPLLNDDTKPSKGTVILKDDDDLPDDDTSVYGDLETIAKSIKWPAEELNDLVRQLILGTPFANKVEIEKLKKEMFSIYEARFHAVRDNNKSSFSSWAETWVQWLLCDYDDEWIYEKYNLMDEVEAFSVIAFKLTEILNTFPKNIYRDIMIDELCSYMEF